MATANPWLQAFDWIRRNTPEDAYFAVDPDYTNAPGEDCHGFRALAERGMMADSNKDTSTVTKQPTLAWKWKRQVVARDGWSSFKLADFERLKTDFGVDWALVNYPPPAGLDCKWHNVRSRSAKFRNMDELPFICTETGPCSTFRSD